MLEQYSNVKLIDGRRAVVRNDYLPEREIVTALGPVKVKVLKVRDRSGSGIHFNSAVVPPYVRGISTGDMSEALGIMLGGEVAGMSPNTVSRLKAQWAGEHAQWNRRDLSSARGVYWWTDGIHTGVRNDDSDGQCLLVIIGVTPEGEKERVAIGDGYRESKESWCELLMDLKKRGLPALARCSRAATAQWASGRRWRKCSRRRSISAAGFTRWVTSLPKSQQGRAKKALQEIGMAGTRADALVAFNDFVDSYSAKYPKVAKKLIEDRDERLAFYDLPAEHWQHLRTTNLIGSTFATVRHRTNARATACRVRRSSAWRSSCRVGEQSWRRIRAPEKLAEMLGGIDASSPRPETIDAELADYDVKFQNGFRVTEGASNSA